MYEVPRAVPMPPGLKDDLAEVASGLHFGEEAWLVRLLLALEDWKPGDAQEPLAG